MEKYQQILEATLEIMKTKTTSEIYSEIFSEVSSVHKFEKGYIYIIAPDDYTKSKIEQFYLNVMNESLESIIDTDEKMKFKIITQNEIKNQVTFKRETDTLNQNLRDKYIKDLNNMYTFNNFVIGNSNRFASTLALKAADQPGKDANPLFFYGQSGLGKTHLMHSIGNYILENDINTKVVYMKAETFADDYFKANQNNTWVKFIEKYEEADVLLVDDIQQLPSISKEINNIQNSFFKLFEKLHSQNKQIVITSDRPPKDLKHLVDRLITRFEWGQVVDITVPDFNHCVDILKRKIAQSIRNPETFPIESIEYIAKHRGGNVRQLEGALKRVIFYCSTFVVVDENSYDIKYVEDALSTMINSAPENKNYHEMQSVEIINQVCSYYSISKEDIVSKSRKQDIILPRQVAMYLIRELYDLTFEKIGHLFGGKDHSTVMHSYEKIRTDIDLRPSLKDDIDQLTKKLKKRS